MFSTVGTVFANGVSNCAGAVTLPHLEKGLHIGVYEQHLCYMFLPQLPHKWSLQRRFP